MKQMGKGEKKTSCFPFVVFGVNKVQQVVLVRTLGAKL